MNPIYLHFCFEKFNGFCHACAVSGSSDHQEGTASESETSDTPRQMHGSNPAGGGRNPQNPPFFPPGLRPSTAGSVPYYQGINQA